MAHSFARKYVFSAVAACFFPAASCDAQSMKISGVIDSGLLYTPDANGSSLEKLTSSIVSPTRVMFTGSEDLGGGDAAIFRLNMPFNLQTGQTGPRLFNIAFVGLESKSLGTLTLGRQWDSTIDLVSGFASSGIWSGYIGSHVGDADNLNASFKVNNAIKYSSPTLYGFDFGATYGLSEDSVKNNRFFSAAAAYSADAFGVGVGYSKIDHPNSQPLGALGADYEGKFTSSSSGAPVVSQETYLIGSSYTIEKVELRAVYSKIDYRYLDSQIQRITNAEVGATYRVNPLLALSASIARTSAYQSPSAGQTEARNWLQLNLGAQYYLSKQTSLYMLLIAQRASNGISAEIYGLDASSRGRQEVTAVGILHRF